MRKSIYILLFFSLHCLGLKAQAFSLNTAPQGLCFEKSIDVNGATALDGYSKYKAGADFIYGIRFIAQERIPGGGFINSLCSMPLHLSAGLGVHYASALIEHETNIDGKFSTFDNELMIPLFLRGKIDFNPGIISPFIACDGGYTFALNASEYGLAGWFIEPQLGIDIHSNLIDLYLAIGVDWQESSYLYIYRYSDKYLQHNNDDIVRVYDVLSKALNFHIGFRW